MHLNLPLIMLKSVAAGLSLLGFFTVVYALWRIRTQEVSALNLLTGGVIALAGVFFLAMVLFCLAEITDDIAQWRWEKRHRDQP